MHYPQNTRSTCITVVSEDCLYQGVFSPYAFSWVYVGEIAEKPQKAEQAAEVLVDKVLAIIANAALSKDDKKVCRQKLAKLGVAGIKKLYPQLLKFRTKPVKV